MTPPSTFIGRQAAGAPTLHLLLMGWVGLEAQITGIGAITPHFEHLKVTEQLANVIAALQCQIHAVCYAIDVFQTCTTLSSSLAVSLCISSVVDYHAIKTLAFQACYHSSKLISHDQAVF